MQTPDVTKFPILAIVVAENGIEEVAKTSRKSCHDTKSRCCPRDTYSDIDDVRNMSASQNNYFKIESLSRTLINTCWNV